MAPKLTAPRNPLLDHRRTDFLLTQNGNSATFMYTDMARFGGIPSLSDSTVIVTTRPYEARPRSNDDWEWKEVNGNWFVNSTGDESIRSPHADNILLEGSSKFCNACYSALGYLAGHLKECRLQEEKGDKDWVDSSQKSVVHHWNIMALHRAAHKGCPLCKTLWTRCFNNDDWALAREARIELFWTSDAARAWDGSNPGEARLTCALFSGGDAPIHEATYLNIFRFQLWPCQEFSRYFENDIVGDMQQLSLNTPLAPQEISSTEECWSLAQKWLDRCEKNEDGQHNACNIVADNGQVWRPTRLLDLSTMEETGKIWLVSTGIEEDEEENSVQEDRAIDDEARHADEEKEIEESGSKEDESKESVNYEYMTLSHCWGVWGAERLQTLTKSNVDLWQSEGIEIVSLPPTFRHAIEIAGWFNGNTLPSRHIMNLLKLYTSEIPLD